MGAILARLRGKANKNPSLIQISDILLKVIMNKAADLTKI